MQPNPHDTFFTHTDWQKRRHQTRAPPLTQWGGQARTWCLTKTRTIIMMVVLMQHRRNYNAIVRQCDKECSGLDGKGYRTFQGKGNKVWIFQWKHTMWPARMSNLHWFEILRIGWGFEPKKPRQFRDTTLSSCGIGKKHCLTVRLIKWI